jgi:putative oxidoreductase
MKTTALIARILLGFVFFVFGLNGFLHFIPMPPPEGVGGQFLGALFVSHFLVVVFLLQLIPAILLLVNRYVPLALTLLGPVLANIVLFHVFMAPAGLPLPIILSVLWSVVAYQHRAAFAGLFSARSHQTTDFVQA